MSELQDKFFALEELFVLISYHGKEMKRSWAVDKQFDGLKTVFNLNAEISSQSNLRRCAKALDDAFEKAFFKNAQVDLPKGKKMEERVIDESKVTESRVSRFCEDAKIISSSMMDHLKTANGQDHIVKNMQMYHDRVFNPRP